MRIAIAIDRPQCALALWVDGDTTDLTDEALVRQRHFTDDYALKISCGDQTGWGLAEPLIPGVAELLTT